MKRDSGLTGAYGENAAANFLRSNDFELLAANYRSRYGEIDLIARKCGEISFIEVKTLRKLTYSRPMEKVNAAKLNRIRLTAELWLAQNNVIAPAHVDVIEVLAPEDLTKPPVDLVFTPDVLEIWS